MEWHPDDQPEQNDRGSDLNPDYPAQLSQHYLQLRAPRLRYLISEGLDGMGHEPQRIPDPARFVDEGGEDQRPGRNHRQKAKRLRSGQLADGGMVGRPSWQHAGATRQTMDLVHRRRATSTPTKKATARARSGACRVQRLRVYNGMPGSRHASIALS